MSLTTRIKDTETGLIMPWFNREALDFIKTLNISQWKVFEWGAGYSTLWWQNYVKRITTIEHFSVWYNAIKYKVKPNCQLYLRKLIKCKPCPYTTAINETDDLYDCIVIDGRNRVLCAKNVLKHVAPLGYIILDNSERPKYDEAIKLFDRNFKRVLITNINKSILPMRWQTIIWKRCI
jgi:hypothetical protein